MRIARLRLTATATRTRPRESTKMMNNSIPQNASPRFKGQILNKVYRVWLMRKLLPVLIFEIVLLSAVLYLLGKTVFIQRVFENALNVLFINPSQIIGFVIDAFARAPILTQILSIGLAVILAFLVRHLTQGLLRFILVKENYFSRVKTTN